MTNLPRDPVVATGLPLLQRRILNSWKEVAVYTGRGVRTLQRYEQHFGFPVRRPAGKSRSSVMAFCDEVDAWLSQTPTRPAANLAGSQNNGIEMQDSPANHRETGDGGDVCPFCNGTGSISHSERIASDRHVPPANLPALNRVAETAPEPYVMAAFQSNRPGLGSNGRAKANGTYGH